jgi:hypothetical protein
VDEKLPTKISGHVHCLNENPFLLAFEAKKIAAKETEPKLIIAISPQP